MGFQSFDKFRPKFQESHSTIPPVMEFVFNDFMKVKMYHLITHRGVQARKHLERITIPLHP